MNLRKINMGKLGSVVFIMTAVIVVFGSVLLNAYESKLNAEIQKIEKETTEINALIDGLEIEISSKTDIQYLTAIATKNGYTHQQGDQTAYVVSND